MNLGAIQFNLQQAWTHATSVSCSQQPSLGRWECGGWGQFITCQSLQLTSTTGRTHTWGCLLQRPSPRHVPAARTVIMAELGRWAWPGASEETSLRGRVYVDLGEIAGCDPRRALPSGRGIEWFSKEVQEGERQHSWWVIFRLCGQISCSSQATYTLTMNFY